MVKRMETMGASRARMRAKIAGGAQMFQSSANNNSSLASIGRRNVAAVKVELMRMRIPIIAEDTGKNYGRTQYFSSADGIMKIKSATKGEWTY